MVTSNEKWLLLAGAIGVGGYFVYQSRPVPYQMSVEEAEMIQPAPPSYIVPPSRDFTAAPMVPTAPQVMYDEYIPPEYAGASTSAVTNSGDILPNLTVVNNPTNPAVSTRDTQDSVSGEPVAVRVGTLNLEYDETAKGTAEDLRKVFPTADVIGLQEGTAKKRQHVRGALVGTDWRMYGAAGVPQIWNNSRLALLSSNTLGLVPDLLLNGRTLSRAASYCKYRNRRSGRTFWVVNTHTQVHGTKGGPVRAERMAKQYTAVKRLIERLEKSGDPVFLTGDLNNHDALSDNVAPKGYRESAKDGTPIDYIIYNPLTARLLSSTAIPNRRLNTDHPYAVSKFRLTS